MKRKNLTFKEKVFVNTLAKTLSATEAAQSAGMKSKKSDEIMSRPIVQRAIEVAMSEKGLSREDAIETVKRNLKASTPIYSKKGVYLGEKNESNSQLKAAEMVFKLLGDFAPTRTQVDKKEHKLYEILFGENDEKEEYQELIDAKKPQHQIEDAEVVEEDDDIDSLLKLDPI